MASTYEQVYQWSMRDPEGFWAAAAEDIYWDRRWDKVLDDSRPPYYRWFTGGRLNTCFNALDLHIERGRGKQLALIYDSPVTGVVRAYTYDAFRDEVARTAGALRRQGITVGDRVIITRYGADFLLVRNPKHSEWHALRRKLRWGEGPNMH